MGNILEIYNHSIQQALANANNAASLVMESHKTAMQNNTNTLNAINETLRESDRNAIEREKNDIANNQAIDNSFQQNSFTRMLAYKDSGMSDKQVQEQMDKDLAAHRAASGYKSNTKHKAFAQKNKPQENTESTPASQTQSPTTPNAESTQNGTINTQVKNHEEIEQMLNPTEKDLLDNHFKKMNGNSIDGASVMGSNL